MGPPYHIYAFRHGGPQQVFRKIAVAKLANKCLVAYLGPPHPQVKGAKTSLKNVFSSHR